jgi:hypothetical protein
LLAALRKGSLSEASDLLTAKVQGIYSMTSTSLMLQHYLYQSQSAFLQASLAADDDVAGFLKTRYSSTWEGYLRQFDMQDALTERRAKAAGMPLVTVLMPTRETAAMVSMGTWPQGFDPYRFDRELRKIVEKNGGMYLDILPEFGKVPNAEQYYLPVDGHPTRAGQELLAQLLAREVTNGSVSQLTPKSLSESQK